MVTDLVIQPSSSLGRIAREMKTKSFLVAVAIVFSSPLAFADVEELDLYAWQTNQPLPRAWSANLLKKGSDTGDWKGGCYFNSKEGWLQSPDFGADIRSVTLHVASSASVATNSAARRLYLHPISNGITNEQRIAIEPTRTQSYAAQEFSLAEYAASQFVLKFDDNGDRGSWGVIYIAVRYGALDPGEKDAATPDVWSMSSFVPRPGIRTADFSPLGGVIPSVSSNAWQNGRTVRGLHAFYANKPCTNVRVGTPSSTAGGLYVIVTNDVHGSLRTLALHGTGEGKAHLLLPIALDAESRVTRLCVDYHAWSLGGTVSTALNFSYRPLDDISDLEGELAEKWTDVQNATWGSGERDSIRTADVPSDCLRGRKYICFRWWVPKQSNSSIMCISDVRVSAEVRPRGFAVFVR